MVTITAFRKIALSFPRVAESPHFERTSFRIDKKIFATLDEKKQSAVVKLNPVDQSAFCSFDKSVIRPVAGTWGRMGWTLIDLSKIKKNTLVDAVSTAYSTAAQKKRSKKTM